MDDLIDRQNAIDVLELLADKMSDEGKTVMAQAVAVLKDLQSAEPERKKGYWIVKEEDWRKQLEWDECSECGFATTKQYNFCPNCGADMW